MSADDAHVENNATHGDALPTRQRLDPMLSEWLKVDSLEPISSCGRTAGEAPLLFLFVLFCFVCLYAVDPLRLSRLEQKDPA